ncbi:MAG: metallopeptidase TldD-related protein [Candidatus Nanopelagicales bacterium]|nr:metallopeptidase TldD-related protein [Candidatus Nanopelagicales bacterium]MDZ4250630.1 metallopeptidase TldD-related protein [Candidatus Nanopelagicales bacterium]
MISPQEIIERALECAGRADLAVVANHSSQVHLRWAANSLTTNGHMTSRDVDVVAFDRRAGAAATATVSGQVRTAAEVDDLVRRASRAASQAKDSEDNMPLVGGSSDADWGDSPAETGAAALADVAAGLGSVFQRGAATGVEHFGYAEHDITTTYLGTSSGLRRRYVQPQGRLEGTAKGAARTRSAWAGIADTDLASTDVEAIDERLRASLDRQATLISRAPGRYPVLLMPSAVADLMIELYWAADLRSATEGRSVFASGGGRTRIGEDLAARSVTLSSEPLDRDPSMRCADFETCAAPGAATSPFDNGLPLGATSWLEEGKLKHLMSTRQTAERAGLSATPGIDNLRLAYAGGAGSPEDLIARMGDGLVVTCLWYNRVVDPQTLLVTGLTRDGVYVVEGGEIVGSCGNFRFNESPVSILGRIVDAGSTVRTLAREMGDYFNRAAMPPLLVDGFNMSTASEAL